MVVELRQINSVHAEYRADVWEKRNHYVFWFHDSTFECVAEGFDVALHNCSMSELLAQACLRLVE